jgi:hypothetical protein
VSELRSVIDELRGEDLASLPDARIEEDFAELHRSLEQLEAERLRRLDELSRRRPFERDGHLSAASWLVATFNASWTAARESVRLAAALARMPLARKALEEATISLPAVRELSRAFESEPEAFASSEEHLVELATAHPVADLRRIVSLWREGLERDRGTDPEERVRQRRSLHASKTFEGMVRVDGDLDPENGELLLTALRAVIDAESRSGTEHEDPRTPAQKRADALGEVCRGGWTCPSGPPWPGSDPTWSSPCRWGRSLARTRWPSSIIWGPWLRVRPGACPATPRCAGWSSVLPPSPSTSAGGPTWSRPPSGERSPSGTGGAGSPAAAVPTSGATPTT